MSNLKDFFIKNGVLISYLGNDEHVVVPEGVTELDWPNCFTNENLRSVELPDTIKTIDSRSFPDMGRTLADENGFCRAGKFLVNYVGNAEIIVVPEGITELGWDAISGNKTVKKLVLPSSIEVIGIRALKGCEQLEEVVFAENSPSFKGFDSCAFAECSKLEKINFPKSIEMIGGEVFSGCDKLFDDRGFLVIGSILFEYKGIDTHVIVPAGVEVIADSAFAKTSGIEKVIIPDGVKTIGSEAFRRCKTLKSVEISDSVTEIGRDAFGFCENLEEITLKGVKRIHDNAFSRCTKLQKVIFSAELEEIGDGAFYGCSALTELCLPSGLKKLGDKVQANKDSLSDSFSHFEGAFKGTGLSFVEIPDSVEQIGCAAFCNCRNLKSIRIPDSVRIIGESAFAYCTELQKVIFSAELEEIGDGAFCGCSALTEICLPSGLKKLGNKVYGNKDSFSHFEGAFKGTGLSFVEIPDSVEQIGCAAFCDCGNLKSIRVPGSVRIIADSAFARCPQLEKTVLEEGIQTINREAFYLCEKITDIVIPESVQFIGGHAFFRCDKLENVSIPAHLTGDSKEEYLAYLGIADENGCIIQDGVLVHYVGPSDEVRITDGVTVLSEGVFNAICGWERTGSEGVMRIILPDSVKVFHESNFGWPKPEINLPAGYLRQADKLPADFTYTLITGVWRDQVTLEDLAALAVYQSGKDLIYHCQQELEKDPEKSAHAFMEVLNDSKKGAAYGKAAEFIFTQKDKIKQETIDAFYAFASAAKAKKALEILGPFASGEAATAGSKSGPKGRG